MKLLYSFTFIVLSTLTAYSSSEVNYKGVNYSFLDYTSTHFDKELSPIKEIEDGNYFLLHWLNWSEEVTGSVVLFSIKNHKMEGESYQFDQLRGADVLQVMCRNGIADFSLDSIPLSYELFYKNGVFEGNQIRHSSQGWYREECTYLKGKKNGSARMYYPTGALYYEVNYKDDMLVNGDIKLYHPNKQLMAEGSYRGTELWGDWIFY